MDWQQISFEVQKSEVDLISEVLCGSWQSIDYIQRCAR